VGFKLAEMFVDITANDKPAMAGLNRVQGAFMGLGSKLVALGAAIGGGAFFAKAIQGASDLAETTSKVNTVFGDSAGIVTGYADRMAKDFGLTKQPLLDAASIFGLMAKGAGFAQEDAAGFSTTMAQLAADSASFYNVPLDVALEKIRSGLSGEAEPLRAFGVFLSDAAIQAKAAEMGLVGLNGKLSEGQKIAARAAVIQEQLATASGDLARTANGTANQQRKALGDLENATIEFGAAVMPIYTGFLQAASEAIGGVNRWLQSNVDGINTWAQEVGGWLSAVGVMFRNWETTVAIVGVTIGGYLTNIQEMFAWVMGAIGQYGEWFANNWTAVIHDALNAVWTIFQNVFTNIKNLVGAAWEYITNPAGGFHFEFTPILDGFKATMEQLPEIAGPVLSDVQHDIDRLTMKMSDAEVARAETAAGIAANGAAAPAIAAATGEATGAAAAQQARTSSLESFASSLITGAFGKDKIAKDQLAVQRETRDILKAGALGGAAGLTVGVAG
jgi:hypothetical protein